MNEIWWWLRMKTVQVIIREPSQFDETLKSHSFDYRGTSVLMNTKYLLKYVTIDQQLLDKANCNKLITVETMLQKRTIQFQQTAYRKWSKFPFPEFSSKLLLKDTQSGYMSLAISTYRGVAEDTSQLAGMPPELPVKKSTSLLHCHYKQVVSPDQQL